MDKTEEDDETVAMAARRGDHRSMGALIQRHGRAITAAAYRVLGNPDDAEDAAQETFLKVYRALPLFNGQSRFSTWLHIVNRNTIKDRLRRRRRISDARRELTSLRGMSLAMPSGAPKKDVAENLEEMVADLPGPDRRLIFYRFREGLSAREISRRLGSPPFRVRRQLQAILRRLREGGDAP